MRSQLLILICLLIHSVTSLQAAESEPVRVTVENFCRAESDMYFAKFVEQGGFGKFHHERELAPIEKQTVIRLNRDTLYSFGVFDLEASPVTVTLPDPGKRFMSLQIINEDQYAMDVFYAPGTHTITRDAVGTRYVCLAVRTFVNPNNPDDIAAVHQLQDTIVAEQKSQGKFEIASWDPVSLAKVRDALLALAAANGGLDSARMFGTPAEVDPVQHLIGTAAGWGGNPRTAALYEGVEPTDDDGKTAYLLHLKDVPVDGFWSISVYNKEGYFEKNPENAYTLNNITAKPNADGSVTIHFGGDDKSPNWLPTMPGWNYVFRMYRPRKELLDGTWKFPVAKRVSERP